MDLPRVTVSASTLNACIALESWLVDEIYDLSSQGECDEIQ
jgi:hypothetical protein